jgi:hypothetical protein
MMRSNRFGCLTGTGILAALITALAIAGYAFARGGSMYSPGPLSTHGDRTLGGVTSHAETGGDCNACHTAPWESATMADHCTVCHTGIAEEMRDVATMHGTLIHKDPNLGCWHCHPEHRGPDAQLTVMEDASFPHEVVGFSLKGHQLTTADESFTCNDCHQGDITTFASDSCDSCHRQMDVGFMTAHTLSFGSACLDCHDGVDRLGKKFDHNQFSFKITGKHIAWRVQCHINARGLTTSGRPRRIAPPVTNAMNRTQDGLDSIAPIATLQLAGRLQSSTIISPRSNWRAGIRKSPVSRVMLMSNSKVCPWTAIRVIKEMTSTTGNLVETVLPVMIHRVGIT